MDDETRWSIIRRVSNLRISNRLFRARLLERGVPDNVLQSLLRAMKLNKSKYLSLMWRIDGR